jgi:hypothetical protein
MHNSERIFLLFVIIRTGLKSKARKIKRENRRCIWQDRVQEVHFIMEKKNSYVAIAVAGIGAAPLARTGWQGGKWHSARGHTTRKFLVWQRFRVHDSRVSRHCQKALEIHLHKGRSQCKNYFISGLSTSHNSALHALLLFGGYHVICHRLLLNIICFWLNLLQKSFLHKC